MTSCADEITALSREALLRIRPLLLARGELGFVRRGHGDLHLGNIVMIKGRPVLFDAIEFDPIVAAGDVLYDLAFLLMDLMERDLKDAANLVFNRYLSEAGRSENFDALAALPLFLSLRAAIRAKVTAARLEMVPPADARRVGDTAQAYFRYALDVLKPPRPVLVAIGGLSGTGKSILARDLASALVPAPGAVVLRSDVERKYLFGAGETDRLPETAYTTDVTTRVYASIAEKAHRVISAGHSAVVDAVYADTNERSAIAAIAAPRNIEFHGLFLTADLATRLSRVAARVGDASDADVAVARQQERYDLSDLSWTQIDASGSLAQTLGRARDALFDPAGPHLTLVNTGGSQCH